MEMLERYQESLRTQIELNLQNRSRIAVEYDEEAQRITPAYMRDFCTVRSDIGLRTGKTQFIQNFVNDLPATANVLVLASSNLDFDAKCNVRCSRILSMSAYHDLRSTIYVDPLSSLQGRATPVYYDYVFIDTASWLAQLVEDPFFYDLMCTVPTDRAVPPPTFVLLG
jgi:hypothetical protein